MADLGIQHTSTDGKKNKIQKHKIKFIQDEEYNTDNHEFKPKIHHNTNVHVNEDKKVKDYDDDDISE